MMSDFLAVCFWIACFSCPIPFQSCLRLPIHTTVWDSSYFFFCFVLFLFGINLVVWRGVPGCWEEDLNGLIKFGLRSLRQTPPSMQYSFDYRLSPPEFWQFLHFFRYSFKLFRNVAPTKTKRWQKFETVLAFMSKTKLFRCIESTILTTSKKITWHYSIWSNKTKAVGVATTSRLLPTRRRYIFILSIGLALTSKLVQLL